MINFKLQSVTIIKYLSAVIIMSAAIPAHAARAERPICGRDFQGANMEELVSSFELFYEASGFVIIKKEITAENSVLWSGIP
jgi:hypothetical protein